MPIVIGARYNPYSFDDLLKPLAMAQQEYNTVQEGLSSLTDASNQFSRYLEGTQAGERVKQYNQAIDAAVTDMAKNGLRRTNRDTLLGLKRQYNNDIAKINQSAAQLDTLYKGVQQAQLKAQASGDTLFVANMPNVDDLMVNPSAMPIMVSGAGLQQQGMKAAQAESVRNAFNSTAQGQGIMKMYNDIVSGYGYNSAEAQKFLQDASRIPALQQAIASIKTMYNVGNLGQDEGRATQFIMQGIMDGLTYSEKHDWKQDPERTMQLQNDYAIKLAQAKAAAEGTSGLGNGIPNQMINGRLNSPAADDRKEKFKQYFDANGQLTKEGLRQYQGYDTYESSYSPSTGMMVGSRKVHKQDTEFKDFVDNTLKAKDVKSINAAWKAYNSPTSPAYGDTDSYGTIDVPMRATASNELKKQLAFAYGSDAEVPIVVDIDKNNRSWKTKDTIDMEDLMSDEYSVSRIQASPYTKSLIVNFVSKKGGKNVNIELPLTAIAGENSSAMLQSAYAGLEQLEKMPTGSLVSMGGQQMTREQAQNQMYKAIQQAMLNTMSYYDQEASKEPR